MVKLFVGNLSKDVTSEDLRNIFSQFGDIDNCEKLDNKQFGFVHMTDNDGANSAVRALNKTNFKGSTINVQLSVSKPHKLFVGNLSSGTTREQLQDLFEHAGAKVVQTENCEGKKFGFVRIEASRGFREVHQLIRQLNGSNLNGSSIVVELSEEEKRRLHKDDKQDYGPPRNRGGPSYREQPYYSPYSSAKQGWRPQNNYNDFSVDNWNPGNQRGHTNKMRGFGHFADGQQQNSELDSSGDPMALVGNLVGALMGAGGEGQRNSLQSLAGIAMAWNGDTKAEHEIYIGNYPGKFREADVRRLFEDYEIEVGNIRMKNDGYKAFAFAEVENVEMAEKAKANMEGVEIQGRKLRVRSAKDMGKKRPEEGGSESGREEGRSEKRRRTDKEPLKKDVFRHLVAAFVAFIEKELDRETHEDEAENFRGLMEGAKTALNTAYCIPEDGSLKVTLNVEDIFFNDVRNDIRAEHEIYIGNYPVDFTEDDVRKLFEDNGIKVGAVRMKYDTSNFHQKKVFAFAETESAEMVEKAKSEMEEVEIQGRKLRVRSSKDMNKKREDGGSGRDEQKRRNDREPLKKEDFTRHLVASFVSFIERDLTASKEGHHGTEKFRVLIEGAKTDLSAAYSLPEDETLKVPRNIEDIFFRDARNAITVENVEEKEVGDDDNDVVCLDGNDNDGNSEMKGSGNEEELPKDNCEEIVCNDDNDGNSKEKGSGDEELQKDNCEEVECIDDNNEVECIDDNNEVD
eukprot:GFUD01014857.1.p1 GENE.GFUD01014857.1~~GFUD01014857.1.p1  ORF type:complete len:740 (+),score=255.93 GFUD01014857.1:41-2260(+)